MAIEFEKNGIIHCNTVKYNWKQARNIIADSTGDQLSGNFLPSPQEPGGSVWYTPNLVTSPTGYKSYRTFHVSSAYTYAYQNLPSLEANHTYYVSFRYKSTGSSDWFTIGLKRDGADVDEAMMKWTRTNNNWVLFSGLYKPTTSSSSHQMTMWHDSGSGDVYCCQFIMIDLTDTFGSGNEPSKAWCDNNIREHEVFVNSGTVSSTVPANKINTENGANDAYYASNVNGFYQYNYLGLNSNWEPRDYMYMCNTNPDVTEGFIWSKATNYSFDPNTWYYGFWECHGGDGHTSDIYFPAGPSWEPPLALGAKLVPISAYNGGGGMRDWKRVSGLTQRPSFPTQTSGSRFDINNTTHSFDLRVTSLHISKPASTVSAYNNYNGTKITINDINKEWCDRWIDGRSSPIIHIKDPKNLTIEFSKYKKVNRTNISGQYSRAQLTSYLGLSNDTWNTNGADNSHLKAGEMAYVPVFVNDENNKPAHFYVYIKEVQANQVVTDNILLDESISNIDQVPIDIVCNDIEIRPELNEIQFDRTTGTIKCKKLVKNQNF